MTRRTSSAWTDARLVARREVEEKLRSRAFVLSTLLFLALVAASIALPALLFDDEPPAYDVAVVGVPAQELAAQVPRELVDLTLRPVGGERAEQLVRDGRVDAALTVGPDGPVLTALEQVPGELGDALTTTASAVQAQRGLAELGASPQQVRSLLAPVEVEQAVLEASALDPAVVPLLSSAFALLFFFVVYQFGFAIAQGVVQEKESRIVELLVSAVPVRTLLFGKVLGNGALALGQLTLLVAVAVAGAAATGETELLSLLLRNCGWFLGFFTLGFAMLSCLWAAAGAFASRTEDLQSTTAPLQLLVIVPFFAAVYVPEGPVRSVLSFVPLTSPLLMPARLVAGEAEPWEAALSAALLLVAAGLAVLVGERLYRASLLRTRGRTSLRDAWSGRAGEAS